MILYRSYFYNLFIENSVMRGKTMVENSIMGKCIREEVSLTINLLQGNIVDG